MFQACSFPSKLIANHLCPVKLNIVKVDVCVSTSPVLDVLTIECMCELSGKAKTKQ